MRARPVFVRVAAFFLAFASALVLVNEVRHVRNRMAAAEQLRSYRAPRPFKLPEDLDVTVGLVTVDRENARSYTQINLSTYTGRTPGKLWARTFFFSPDDKTGRVWGGDAIEIGWPFDKNGYANVTVAAPCSWCDDREGPRGGHFARVQISDGREATPLPEGGEFFDINTALPVVVHAERVSLSPSRR